MLVIRLQRIGKKKKPSYRLVLSEKTKDPHADNLEILGVYNPVENPKIIELNADRIKHWLSQGAQPSESVSNLLVNQGIIEGKKQKSVSISNKRQAKMDEKNKAKEEAAEAAKAAEAVKAEEAPAEEVKEEEKIETETEEKKDETPKEDTAKTDEASKTEETPAEEAKEEKVDTETKVEEHY